MDGEWTNVKAKKTFKPAKVLPPPEGSQFGGVTSKGTLVPGPIQHTRYGGRVSEGNKENFKVVHHASQVADYDFGIDKDEEVKFEKVSHICSATVSKARMDAKLTQAQLANKVNERTAAIIDLENGTARYCSDLINRIENVLRVKIPRGRQTKSKK